MLRIKSRRDQSLTNTTDSIEKEATPLISGVHITPRAARRDHGQRSAHCKNLRHDAPAALEEQFRPRARCAPRRAHPRISVSALQLTDVQGSVFVGHVLQNGLPDFGVYTQHRLHRGPGQILGNPLIHAGKFSDHLLLVRAINE
jgi:hypothetical protein